MSELAKRLREAKSVIAADRIRDLLEEAAAALSGVRVPVEPTEEMCKAGAPHCGNNSFTAMMVYKAMLHVHSSSASDSRSTGFQGQWIALSERLPKANKNVLFVAPFHGRLLVSLGWKDNDDPDCQKWIDMTATDSDGDYLIEYGVTHWMPLPPPPTARTDSITTDEGMNNE
jgi:hypothetical protein